MSILISCACKLGTVPVYWGHMDFLHHQQAMYDREGMANAFCINALSANNPAITAPYLMYMCIHIWHTTNAHICTARHDL